MSLESVNKLSIIPTDRIMIKTINEDNTNNFFIFFIRVHLISYRGYDYYDGYAIVKECAEDYLHIINIYHIILRLTAGGSARPPSDEHRWACPRARPREAGEVGEAGASDVKNSRERVACKRVVGSSYKIIFYLTCMIEVIHAPIASELSNNMQRYPGLFRYQYYWVHPIPGR